MSGDTHMATWRCFSFENSVFTVHAISEGDINEYLFRIIETFVQVKERDFCGQLDTQLVTKSPTSVHINLSVDI
jgi:hypothetical protein